MKRILIISTILAAAVYLFGSCQKVITINLNDAAPKLIIEGTLTDQLNSCTVKLSKTVNYNEPNTFPPVSGAVITIADNLGNTAALAETMPGTYTAPAFQGVPGRNYTLAITAEGKTYTALSAMPAPVNIDTLVQDSINYGSFGGGGMHVFVWVIYQDPPNIANYYRFVEVVNHRTNTNIYISDDELRDGNLITRRISERDSTLSKGDSVSITLQCIDKNVFTYFDMLDQLSSMGFGGQSATPANPTYNFDNGALGYFSACAVRTKSIVIQ